MELVFATGNRAKLREAGEILGKGVNILSPLQLGFEDDIPETGNSLRANSTQKAKFIFDNTGRDCFADDTGLEVEILAGAPGVHTARYASEDSHDHKGNMRKLLSEMIRCESEASRAREWGLNTVHANRRARFRTVITLILDGKVHYFEGEVCGEISRREVGCGGFGYDPVFIPDEISSKGELVSNTARLTMAELTEEGKNAISHRGRALRAMAAYLNGLK